ncbi:MAG: type II toxin-antitoxin system RelE/ParE family toxin [Prosthecobacter sp.]|nr:type II toxin-antitoxin system RelE/ParE family toxin [Prosthecobacter sp.]
MARVVYSDIAKADQLIERFRSKLEHLAKWNTLGRPRPEMARNCRSYPFGKYCFFFRPVDNGIEVIRVIHSARDLDQIEFPE